MTCRFGSDMQRAAMCVSGEKEDRRSGWMKKWKTGEKKKRGEKKTKSKKTVEDKSCHAVNRNWSHRSTKGLKDETAEQYLLTPVPVLKSTTVLLIANNRIMVKFDSGFGTCVSAGFVFCFLHNVTLSRYASRTKNSRFSACQYGSVFITDRTNGES